MTDATRAAFREVLDIYYAQGFEAMLDKVKELSGVER